MPWSSGGLTHQRFIFNNPVRYVGDPVAAVAATDRHIAEDALKFIEVKYEKIPHVLDPNEALKPDAPKITPQRQSIGRQGQFQRANRRTWGDVEQGFKEADRVFEDTYITKHVNNAQMERRVSVAKWDAGKLTVFASTRGLQRAHRHRQGFQPAAEQSADRLQVHGRWLRQQKSGARLRLHGGGIGQGCRQPVKFEFTREDDYIGMHGRWSSEQRYKIGVKKDGTITAVSLDAVTNMGAYRKQSGNLSGTDFYQIPNFRKAHQTGAHQHRGRGELPGAGVSAIGVRLRVVLWIRSPMRWVSIRSICSCVTGFKNTRARFPSLRTISSSASSKVPSDRLAGEVA